MLLAATARGVIGWGQDMAADDALCDLLSACARARVWMSHEHQRPVTGNPQPECMDA